MTGSAFIDAATWSYGLALVAYTLFALRVVLGWRGGARASLLAGAIVSSAIWAAAAVVSVRSASPFAGVLMSSGDVMRYGFWLAFVANLLGSTPRVTLDAAAPAAAATTPRGRWLVTLPIAAALVACLLLSYVPVTEGRLGAAGAPLRIALQLGLAILGLVMVEQLMRRAPAQVRWSLRPMALALGGLFAFDLFMYADAMLYNRLDVDFWIARGVAHALVIPFVAVATARNSGWTIDLHMSRGAVFHSTALVISGTFLLAVAGAGYLVRFLGGSLAGAIQVELMFAALLAVALVTTSGRFRSTLRVYVSKHFFSYRYDYREEWLRFTRTLADEAGAHSLNERVILALSALVESPAGALWLADDKGALRSVARLNIPQPDAVLSTTDPLPVFLGRTRWIVNVQDWAQDATSYDHMPLPPWLAGLSDAWLLIPLLAGADLLGFVVLTTPRTPVDVDWEVRDLLKTASRQAGSYIAQARATEALLEARKFDAFNRMSAFVVHDLKNLIAQQSLLLRNAERHRDKPEFQADMLDTVKHVVGRMNHLMMQLRAGTTPVAKPHAVALAPLVRRVCTAKSDGVRPLEIDVPPDILVMGHEERLEHVIGHLVQNALDASVPGKPISLRLVTEGSSAVLEVRDRGAGMSPAYVRERLGKPFETTKPAGMGIGVYESSQYIASVGGTLAIDSAVGEGTCVRVRLAVADAKPVAASHEASV